MKRKLYFVSTILLVLLFTSCLSFFDTLKSDDPYYIRTFDTDRSTTVDTVAFSPDAKYIAAGTVQVELFRIEELPVVD